MTIASVLTLLLLASDPPAAPPASHAAVAVSPPAQAPCRLLTVEAKGGGETFLSCRRASVRLESDRRYELSWNPTIKQLAVVGHGADNDQILLVSSLEEAALLVEDLTGELLAAAIEAEPKRPFIGLRVTDLSRFGGANALKVGATEPDTTKGAVAFEWPVALNLEPGPNNPHVVLVR